MKCIRCNRELIHAAVTIRTGYHMGRVCAAKAGLLTEKQKLRQCAQRDTKTRDWVQELAHG